MLNLFEFHIFGWNILPVNARNAVFNFNLLKKQFTQYWLWKIRKKINKSLDYKSSIWIFSIIGFFFNDGFSVIGVCYVIERTHSAVNAYAFLHHKHIFISYGGTSIRISVGKRNISDDWQKIDTNIRLASEYIYSICSIHLHIILQKIILTIQIALRNSDILFYYDLCSDLILLNINLILDKTHRKSSCI